MTVTGPGSRIVASDVTPVPWANGAGRTRELMTGAGWRLSLAELTAPAPYSRMPGRDRIHLPLGDYTLRIDGTDRPACRHRPMAFTGEVPVTLVALDTPTTALNLITERRSCRGEMRVRRVGGLAATPPSLRALVLLDGDTPVALSPESLTPIPVDGLVAEIHVHPHL